MHLSIATEFATLLCSAGLLPQGSFTLERPYPQDAGEVELVLAPQLGTRGHALEAAVRLGAEVGLTDAVQLSAEWDALAAEGEVLGVGGVELGAQVAALDVGGVDGALSFTVGLPVGTMHAEWALSPELRVARRWTDDVESFAALALELSPVVEATPDHEWKAGAGLLLGLGAWAPTIEVTLTHAPWLGRVEGAVASGVTWMTQAFELGAALALRATPEGLGVQGIARVGVEL